MLIDQAALAAAGLVIRRSGKPCSDAAKAAFRVLGRGRAMRASSAVLHTFVGRYINPSEAMSGGVAATFIDGIERTGHADATHAAHFSVDVQTAGATLGADSGHDYSTLAAVPEPSSFALLLAGAGLVAWRTRRRACR